jgi:transketolase
MIDVTTWSGGARIGGSLSAADVLTALYYKYLIIRPEEPDWPGRDRVIMSKGHGVGLASVLADRGYYPIDSDLAARAKASIAGAAG